MILASSRFLPSVEMTKVGIFQRFQYGYCNEGCLLLDSPRIDQGKRGGKGVSKSHIFYACQRKKLAMLHLHVLFTLVFARFPDQVGHIFEISARELQYSVLTEKN
ncbi:MAG: hypothetical protein D4R93_04265 [Deltaproteobacteria bacterium]|nr:MAG: hypothetical protein D4R93_04265 [Deltaproteobacteria bacterium]